MADSATLFAVLLQLVAARVAAVAELTDARFEDALGGHEHAVVFFYSRACRHCGDFMPTFRRAAAELLRNEPPVHAATLCCDDDGGALACRRAAVDHLPSVKVFRRGVLCDEYDGARTVDAIVAYVRRLAGVASAEVAPAAVGEFVRADRVVVVLAILPPAGALRATYFRLPAHLSKDMRFGHVTVAEEARRAHNLTYGVTLYRAAHMRTKFEPSQYHYDDDDDDGGGDLLAFLLRHRHGLLGMRDARHVDDFAPPLVIAYLRVDLRLRAKMFSYWRNRIMQVAVAYRAELEFTISPVDDFRNEFVKFGLTPPPQEAPLVFAILADNSKYLMEDAFSPATFDAFLKGMLSGRLEPHLRSQPVPPRVAEAGVVRTVVAKNFGQEVWRNDKDVLIEFFAPWCSLCKQLADVLDRLARTLMEEPVAIYKMDATENEIPAQFDAGRFPAVYFVPSADKEAVALYAGGATVREVLAFVSAHASAELSAFDRRGAPKKDEL